MSPVSPGRHIAGTFSQLKGYGKSPKAPNQTLSGVRERALRNPTSVAVGRPMPWFARQVVEAVACGVGHEPVPAPVAGGDRAAAVAGEIDGQPLLVHRRAGLGGGRAALRRRHLVDGVVRRAAMLHPELDLCI